MQYTVPFTLHDKQNHIAIDYQEMPDAYESGFYALNLPFDLKECIGYPMLHAYFDDLNLKGYERYCGWIQIIRREEYASLSDSAPCNISYELDVSEDFRKRGVPYFSVGYPAELFDAPCSNLNGKEKLIWRAYTYLVAPPSRMNRFQLQYLAGFSWGYTENCKKEVSVLDFYPLTGEDWNTHKQYAELDA